MSASAAGSQRAKPFIWGRDVRIRFFGQLLDSVFPHSASREYAEALQKIGVKSADSDYP